MGICFNVSLVISLCCFVNVESHMEPILSGDSVARKRNKITRICTGSYVVALDRCRSLAKKTCTCKASYIAARGERLASPPASETSPSSLDADSRNC